MIEVTTNHVPRDIIEAYELTADERAEFDYHDWKKIDAGEDSASFFRYKGQLYDLAEFERWESIQSPTMRADGRWDGFTAWTYFSGVLVRYVDEFERVIVARYFVNGDEDV